MRTYIVIVLIILFAFVVLLVCILLLKKLSPSLKRLFVRPFGQKGPILSAEWEEPQNLISNMDPKSSYVRRDSEQADKCSRGLDFYLSELWIFHLLCLYCAVKSAQECQPFSLPIVLSKLFPGYSQNPYAIRSLSFIAYGVLITFGGVIGQNQIDFSGQTVTIKQIPNGIFQSVDKELTRRIEEGPINKQYQKQVQSWKQAIDDYFTTS